MPMIVFASCLTVAQSQLFDALQCAANVFLAHRRELWRCDIPGGTLDILTVFEVYWTD